MTGKWEHRFEGRQKKSLREAIRINPLTVYRIPQYTAESGLQFKSLKKWADGR